MKSETVRARIEPKLKHDAESVLSKLGLSFSQAIELFLCQVNMRKGLPFDVKIPNKETRKAMEDTDKGKGIVRCKDTKDMFEKLGI